MTELRKFKDLEEAMRYEKNFVHEYLSHCKVNDEEVTVQYTDDTIIVTSNGIIGMYCLLSFPKFEAYEVELVEGNQKRFTVACDVDLVKDVATATVSFAKKN